jgi:predicted N-formylglutamate amidohydrolase
MHSFTPVWAGHARTVEVGVLYDHDEAPGAVLAKHLADAGFVVRLNEPYSGRGGFMFCAQSHTTKHGRKALELEVRQDLAASPPWRARFVRALAQALPAAFAA